MTEKMAVLAPMPSAEGHDHGDRRSRRAPQPAHRIADVLRQLLEQRTRRERREPPLSPARRRRVSISASRRARSSGTPDGHLLVGRASHVAAQLGVEVPLDPPSADQISSRLTRRR